MIFCNIHNIKILRTGVKKFVSIPIVADREDDIYNTLFSSSGSSENVIKRLNLNSPDIGADIRMSIVKSAQYQLSGNPENPYTVFSGNDVKKIQSDKMSCVETLVCRDDGTARAVPHQSDETSSLDVGTVRTVPHQSENVPVINEDIRSDPVERNRTSLSQVSSVFLPDGKSIPNSCGFPVNFLKMRHPYVTSMPMFFPCGKGGLHDPDRAKAPTELEFVLHYLRNVRKELQEDPIFSSLATFRLETAKLYACFNALRGFTVNDENRAEVDENYRLRFMHHTGSRDYYIKQNLDLQARSSVIGFPQILYTFSCSNHWEITLASALMQEGYEVGHVENEPDSEYLADSDPGKEYTVHSPSVDNHNCPAHMNCERSFISEFLDRDPRMKEDLLKRNLYTVNRIFQQRSRALVEYVMKSPTSGLNVKAFHDIKEFANGFPHIHGVAWRQLDGVSEEIFKKVHEGKTMTEAETQVISDLADSILCVSTNPAHIARVFPNLSENGAEMIAVLASQHQRHTCTSKCERESKVNCWYNYPQEPSATTIVAFPPVVAQSRLDDGTVRTVPHQSKAEAKNLVVQSMAIKDAVKGVLCKLTREDRLSTTDLESLLEEAMGNIAELEGGGFEWKGRIFPSISVNNRHSVNVWKKFLAQLYERSEEKVLHLAVYHAALSVSHTGHHNLVLRRRVADTWVVEYNPHCLGAMKSNICVRLILHTPQQVFDYITKGNDCGEDLVGRKLQDLSAQGVVDAEIVAIRAKKMMEVCQSEAFFRMDNHLFLAENNVTVAWIDSRFPHKRGSSFVSAEDGEGITLPCRPGEYNRRSRIEDKYQKK